MATKAQKLSKLCQICREMPHCTTVLGDPRKNERDYKLCRGCRKDWQPGDAVMPPTTIAILMPRYTALGQYDIKQRAEMLFRHEGGINYPGLLTVTQVDSLTRDCRER